MLSIALAVLISYLLGSIPTGYLLVKLLRGVDIRQYGSGNIGATNVSRVLGKPAALIVLFIDIVKGFLATAFITRAFGVNNILAQVIIAVAVICGHNWTIFLKFRGGKGVATTIGAVAGFGVNIPGIRAVLLLSLLVWLVVFLLVKIVAVASIALALSLTIFTVVFKQPIELVVLSFILLAFISVRHKSNIIKLLQQKS